jgi:hypothetical protein
LQIGSAQPGATLPLYTERLPLGLPWSRDPNSALFATGVSDLDSLKAQSARTPPAGIGPIQDVRRALTWRCWGCSAQTAARAVSDTILLAHFRSRMAAAARRQDRRDCVCPRRTDGRRQPWPSVWRLARATQPTRVGRAAKTICCRGAARAWRPSGAAHQRKTAAAAADDDDDD